LDFSTVFFFLKSKIISVASNPPPRGPSVCIYVPSDNSVVLNNSEKYIVG
jgi:hypothetical protein